MLFCIESVAQAAPQYYTFVGSSYQFYPDGSPDTDGDGTPDDQDGCPNDPDKIDPGICGCGNPDTDTDMDDIPDCIDNCFEIGNPGQIDMDHDGTGDACEQECRIYVPQDYLTIQSATDAAPDDCGIFDGVLPDPLQAPYHLDVGYNDFFQMPYVHFMWLPLNLQPEGWSDGNSPIAAIRIYRRSNTSDLWEMLKEEQNNQVLSYIDYDIVFGETYFYAVAAVNSGGYKGPIQEYAGMRVGVWMVQDLKSVINVAGYTTPNDVTAMNIDFVDANTGYAVLEEKFSDEPYWTTLWGSFNVLIKTTDSGLTWTPVARLPQVGRDFPMFTFMDEQH